MSETDSTPTILMVDDEPNILDGYRRSLRGRFTVVTAGSGTDALVALQQAARAGNPFAVVVSDMMMPVMNGADFLGRVSQVAPDAVQILLSGQADLESTISAVNGGNLFRFLTKPCDAPDLERALSAAIEQRRLVGAERELLERTLTGAVDVLTELLSMASPEAFTRSERVRTLVGRVAELTGVDDWRLPLAAMLSQVGCIAVPDDLLHRARNGLTLSCDEREVYLSHPQTSRRLLERIPRLEDIASWVGAQPVGSSAIDLRAAVPDATAPPAQFVLQSCLAYLAALDATGDPETALIRLKVADGYPSDLVDAIEEAAAELAPQGIVRELAVAAVRPGMLLDADVKTTTGMILVRKGERVTEALAMRLANFARTVGVNEPVLVLIGV